MGFAAVTVSLVASLGLAAGGDEAEGLDTIFRMNGDACIHEEEHFGIVNGKLTAGINHRGGGSIGGLWAPPYVSSDFLLELRVSGEKPLTGEYTWWPIEVHRSGAAQGVAVSSVTALIHGTRAGLLMLDIENTAAAPKEVPIEFAVTGTLDRTNTWEFSRPQSATPAPAVAEGQRLVKTQGDCAIVVQSGADNLQWDDAASVWRTTLALEAGARTRIHVAFAIGGLDEATAACEGILADPGQALADTRAQYQARVADLFAKLPTLESDNQALVDFYNRSLVHFIMNRWDVPEFLLNPYYSTGSVKGGCVCNYLWNFGEVWEILPLYDPDAARAHIIQFLKTDITTHFAFMPITGEAFGPWYPVNQEKILGLIYYYIQNTGDATLLDEMVDGKTVLDWAVVHALCLDDPDQPVALIDYGPSNSHLELRRGFPYNQVMPDLNGRRYANYMMAFHLCALAGKPAPYLEERAHALKKVLREQLWEPDANWFWFLDERGAKDMRYTVQLYKLFASAVLDPEQEAGLLSHLNETEFLSAQGLHSMSKVDIAYDQVDIDNGGGGICTCFTPQIAERFYKSGHAAEAGDLIERTLWWGQRMPYWGDSIVANSIDYRRDTPLQCTLDGVAVAQCILFGMFGVSAQFNGDIVIDPHPPAFAAHVALKGLRIRGVTLDIRADATGYDVATSAGKSLRAPLGTPILVRNHGAELSALPEGERPRAGL